METKNDGGEKRGRYKKESKGSMTVQEAGRRGGQRTAQTHGHEFFAAIGHKGGQTVKELIAAGKKAKEMASEK